MALTVGTSANTGVSVPRTAYRAPTPKVAYRPPARRRTSTSTRSSGSRTGSRTGSSYSGSTSRSAPRSSPGGARPGSVPRVTTPAIPSLAQFLAGDTAYQQSIRGGQRTLADFLSELGRQRGEAGASFTQSKSLLEQDRVKQLENLENEYASRGLLSSGLYGEAQGDFQEQFQNQLTALQQGQTSLLADLLSQETNFRREQELAAEVARQEALRRRAERYGVT